MRGHCPDCAEARALETRAGEGVEIATCPSCGGVWIDAAQHKLVVGIALGPVMMNARFSPGRCASGHSTSRGKPVCRCGAPLVAGPACDAALSKVRSGPHDIDACTSCGGIWLSAQVAAALTKIDTGQLPPAGALSGPAPMKLRPRRSVDPFKCATCEKPLVAAEAYAFDGAMYCAEHRPDGAVSGR